MYEKCLKCEKLGGQCLSFLMSMELSELAEWCKQRKAHLQMTHAKLSELSGIPLGTINRFFAQDLADFRYSNVRAIVCALIGYTGGELPCPDQPEEQKALESALESKDAEIAELRSSIQAMQEKHEIELASKESDSARKVDYIKEQVTAREVFMKRKDKVITILGVIVGILVIGVIALFAYDSLNPTVGWFRY